MMCFASPFVDNDLFKLFCKNARTHTGTHLADGGVDVEEGLIHVRQRLAQPVVVGVLRARKVQHGTQQQRVAWSSLHLCTHMMRSPRSGPHSAKNRAGDTELIQS